MMNLLILSIITIIISYIIIGKFLTYIQEKISQPLLNIGPDHKEKAGTPTMGGVAVFSTYIIFTIIILFLYNFFDKALNKNIMAYYDLIIIFIAVSGYFVIGFIDDYNKVKFKQNEKGLSAKSKIVLQFIISLIIVVMLYNRHFSTNINFNIINQSVQFGLVYYLFIPILFLAMTNATNLTDGLDGLLTSNAIISILALTVVAVLQNNFLIVYSNVILISILVSFYVYNKNPAKIFLGDVGSLAIGSYLTIVAILLKVELLLFFFSIVYFFETLSVIIQVIYFKITKKRYGEGKRFFLMAPFHHHLEKKGFGEKRIVLIFSLINIIFSIIGIFIFIK